MKKSKQIIYKSFEDLKEFKNKQMQNTFKMLHKNHPEQLVDIHKTLDELDKNRTR